MTSLIIACIISVTAITALFFAWYFYLQARNKERMELIDRGEKLEDIFRLQKQNRFKFIFPWLKVSVVILGMSVSFLLIGIYIFFQADDSDKAKGFFITFIIGICLGISCMINHFISRKNTRK
ncbi:DUF6249 domain-containing protein [Tenacibaculum caenipelagi]|uniref:DUF6249 domain-containing protein n=1 Tax=Tenacibaculum caenipelagi TaxID=1325435 RepID=A0A4R6TAV6_9FLAO|nr:DUF6249 domain-containing protein [Tenacibaculum caenipelagi]TDQ24036.1 hypothetical protein DFQ07_2578 [Tenacibaculum caenipelagi]